jgi:hypothetical protein
MPKSSYWKIADLSFQRSSLQCWCLPKMNRRPFEISTYCKSQKSYQSFWVQICIILWSLLPMWELLPSCQGGFDHASPECEVQVQRCIPRPQPVDTKNGKLTNYKIQWKSQHSTGRKFSSIRQTRTKIHTILDCRMSRTNHHQARPRLQVLYLDILCRSIQWKGVRSFCRSDRICCSHRSLTPTPMHNLPTRFCWRIKPSLLNLCLPLTH